MNSTRTQCPIRAELLARGGPPAALVHLAAAVEQAVQQIATGIVGVALALDAERRGADAVAVQMDAVALGRTVQQLLAGSLLSSDDHRDLLADVAGQRQAKQTGAATTPPTGAPASPAARPTPTSRKRTIGPARRRKGVA